MKRLPPEMREWYFQFNWSNDLIWSLDIPIETKLVSELEWHLDIPIWSSKKGMLFDLKPRDFLKDPNKFPLHAQRLEVCDLSFPIDLMPTSYHVTILDGVHRLVKHIQRGHKTIDTRLISRKLIPQICVGESAGA